MNQYDQLSGQGGKENDQLQIIEINHVDTDARPIDLQREKAFRAADLHSFEQREAQHCS